MSTEPLRASGPDFLLLTPLELLQSQRTQNIARWNKTCVWEGPSVDNHPHQKSASGLSGPVGRAAWPGAGGGGVLQSSPHIPPGQAGIWEIPEGLAQLGMADQRALASLTPSHPLLAKTPPLSLWGGVGSKGGPSQFSVNIALRWPHHAPQGQPKTDFLMNKKELYSNIAWKLFEVGIVLIWQKKNSYTLNI